MDKERFLKSGLLEQYVLGLTSEEESREVERFANTFPEIQAEIEQLQQAMQAFAKQQIGLDTTMADPPKTESLQSDARSSKSISRGDVTLWLLAASILFFGLLSIHYHRQYQKTNDKLAQLSADFRAMKQICERDQQELGSTKTRVAFYEHYLTTPIQLTGTGLAPDLKVRVYWNEQISTAMLHIIEMPKQPEDKQYQIWADLDGKMVNLGMINPQNEHPQSIRCLPKAKSLNITLEPAGGSEEPHVDQLYANALLY